MTTTNCRECVHYEAKAEETFYCKLLDTVYTNNQDKCEDFEAAELQESVSYECD